MDAHDVSDSLRNPQIEPADHAYVVLSDFGPDGGGWGPLAISLPWQPTPTPFVYTGTAEHVIAQVAQACQVHAQRTGRPTKLVRFSQREDVFSVGGSS